MQHKQDLSRDLLAYVYNKLKNGATFQEIQQWRNDNPRYSDEQFFSALVLLKHGTLTPDLFCLEVIEFLKGIVFQRQEEQDAKKSKFHVNIERELNIKENYLSESEFEEFKKLPKNKHGHTWSPTFKFAGEAQRSRDFHEALSACEEYERNNQNKFTVT